jgi:hypothetical protein
MYHHPSGAEYREAWDEADEKEARRARLLERFARRPCPYLGPVTGELLACKFCNRVETVRVHQCLHPGLGGKCTERFLVGDRAINCCSICEEYPK